MIKTMVALDLLLKRYRTSRRGDSHRSGCCKTLESREQGRCNALSRELMEGIRGGGAGVNRQLSGQSWSKCSDWLLKGLATPCDTLPVLPEHRTSATFQGVLPSWEWESCSFREDRLPHSVYFSSSWLGSRRWLDYSLCLIRETHSVIAHLWFRPFSLETSIWAPREVCRTLLKIDEQRSTDSGMHTPPRLQESSYINSAFLPVKPGKERRKWGGRMWWMGCVLLEGRGPEQKQNSS